MQALEGLDKFAWSKFTLREQRSNPKGELQGRNP
mgnify:CR=1 FL=1